MSAHKLGSVTGKSDSLGFILFTISGSKPAGEDITSALKIEHSKSSQYLVFFAYLVRICRDTQGPWPIAPSSMLGSWDEVGGGQLNSQTRSLKKRGDVEAVFP